jgi:hypothetical protein
MKCNNRIVEAKYLLPRVLTRGAKVNAILSAAGTNVIGYANVDPARNVHTSFGSVIASSAST